MKKNLKGFTLIELIVVIAIIGVLAAILVPAMMGWVTKAEINSANTNAKSVFTNAQTVLQEYETKGVNEDGTQGAITGNITTSSDTSQLVKDIKDTITSSSATAKWAVYRDGYVVASAVYSKNGTTYMGAYPNMVDQKSKTSYDETATTLKKALGSGKSVGSLAGTAW